MKKAIVIVNGIQFPYFLIEHAIAKSKESGNGLHVIFLISGEDMPEGYAFPSDIDLAETVNDKQDSEEHSMAVLQSQRRLLYHMAKSAGINGSSEVLVEPSSRDIEKKLAQGSILYIAPNYGDVLLQGLITPSMDDLVTNSPIPVEVVDQPYQP